ncbi:MAG: hypothetical protein IPH52_07200 [Leptospiraceae bacterium]|nr:hypothetical protein [Leptospiraceae bacterium]
MKRNIFIFLTFLIVFSFLQADTITNHIYNAVRKMKTGLSCIDGCWEDRSFTSPMQILNCVTKCPREIECRNSNDLEDKIMCNTEKSVDAIFKCHKANIKNQKAARKCSSDVVTKYLTKNVDEFEKSFSNISDEIDSIMGYSSFANNASYSSEVRAASRVIEEDNYRSTIPNTWKNKTVTEIRNYEASQENKVAGMNKAYNDIVSSEQETRRRQAERRRSQPQPAYNSDGGGNQSSGPSECENARTTLSFCQGSGVDCSMQQAWVDNTCGGSSSANTNNAPSSPSQPSSPPVDRCHCILSRNGIVQDLGMTARSACYSSGGVTATCN